VITFYASAHLHFDVEIHDPDVISRCVDNVDGWREEFYDLSTPEEVVEHLTWNCGVNGRRLSRLDGWADLSDDAVSFTHVSSYYNVGKIEG